MMRWDIINHLIKKNNYKSYLEIGYYKGWSFDQVQCESKMAVDPNPSKLPFYEQMQPNTFIKTNEKEQIFKFKSDDFFEFIKDHPQFSGIKWDIIFIDGLHEKNQVLRDTENSLKHLSPGGVIVLHDCNPASYEMTTTGTSLGEWTGDVYKAIVAINSHRTIGEFDLILPPPAITVVDTDYGVGILKKENDPQLPIAFYERNLDVPWEYFDKNRKRLLNLITPEEFLKIES